VLGLDWLSFAVGEAVNVVAFASPPVACTDDRVSIRVVRSKTTIRAALIIIATLDDRWYEPRGRQSAASIPTRTVNSDSWRHVQYKHTATGDVCMHVHVLEH